MRVATSSQATDNALAAVKRLGDGAAHRRGWRERVKVRHPQPPQHRSDWVADHQPGPHATLPLPAPQPGGCGVLTPKHTMHSGLTTTRPRAPRRILIIDDAPEILDLLRDLLEGEGYRVSLMENEVQDLSEVRTLQPDLIILDVLFGNEARGIRLLEALRLDPATGAIPVILCTGAVDHIRRIEGNVASHLAGIVLKPFDLDEMLREIDDAWCRVQEDTLVATAAGGAMFS